MTTRNCPPAFPLPCPWCGSKRLRVMHEATRPWVSCTRKTCQADGPMRRTVDAAIAAWNAGPTKR